MGVVVKNCSNILAHAPNFIRYGSKPYRDITDSNDPDSRLEKQIYQHVRPYKAAAAYPPNQVFIGNMQPDELNEIPQP